jgi:hypothetical protein
MCRFRVESVNVFVLPQFDFEQYSSINKQLNKFAHAQTLFRMSSTSGRMNIARVNIEILLDTRESNSDVFPLF